jgi:hypothetical protein
LARQETDERLTRAFESAARPATPPGEPDIVADDGRWSDRQRLRIGDIELLELDLVLPDLPQEVLEHLDRELLAGAAAVAEAELRAVALYSSTEFLYRRRAKLLERKNS